MEKAYQEALAILTEHRDGLTQLANKLIEKEVIFGEDLEIIFGKRPWATKEELMKSDEKSTEEAEANKEPEQNA